MTRDVYLGVGLVVLAVIFWTELGKVKNPAIMKEEMSAAVFPWLMVGTLAFLGFLLALSSFVRRKRGGGGDVTTGGPVSWWTLLKTTYLVPGLMFASLTVYVFLIPVVGFYSLTAVFFLGVGLLLGGWGRKNVVTVVITSLGAALLVYYVFEVNMGVFMPRGFLR
jgi:Tripartite tricarboxylate transporter TctB family